MKKQFFYAAMALAMMSSCTNEIVPIEPEDINPGIENEDQQVIELGINAPGVTASTRGLGSVGDEAGDKNTWNSQQLYVYMIDEVGAEATDAATSNKIFDNSSLIFKAPRSTDDPNNPGGIRIYKNSPAITNDMGTLQYLYYPVSGKYDFLGFHSDDAGNATNASVANGLLTVDNLSINGTQDLLAANTLKYTETADLEKYTNGLTKPAGVTDWATFLADWAFSARSARADIKPILDFKHQLTRVKFFVRAGSDITAANKLEGGSWVENVTKETTPKNMGMTVTRIAIAEMETSIKMAIGKTSITTTANSSQDSKKTFYVRQKNTANNNMLENQPTGGSSGNNIEGLLLTPVAPQYPIGATLPSNPLLGATEKGTPVGEPVMFFSDAADPLSELKVSLDLTQRVIDTEEEKQSPTEHVFTYADKSQSATIYVPAPDNAFKPGYSYDVYITVYGFERIEVTAQLSAWEDGGDVDTNIEENTQSGAQNITITAGETPAADAIDTDGGSYTLTVQGNAAATFSSNVDWITFTDSPGTRAEETGSTGENNTESETTPSTPTTVTSTKVVNIAKNEGAERTGAITITIGKKTKTITVTQAGTTTSITPTLKLTSDATVTLEGDTKSVTVTATSNVLPTSVVTYNTENQSGWLTASADQPSNSSGTYSWTYTAADLPEGVEERSATITITASADNATPVTKTVTVTQKKATENSDEV